jgi:N-acyl homoserine lactone hydrolase
MKVRAEPIPLAQPLPGGVQGASVVVEPLKAGESLWPETFFDYRGRGPIARLRALGLWSKPESWRAVPVPAYLIHHPGLGPILIDTGLHASVARDARDNLGRFTSRHYRLVEGQDVASQLRSRGLEASDISLVILTHLHEDHASAIESFPEALFVASAQEWEAATTGRLPILRGYRPAHYDYPYDFNTVDLDGDFVESYGPFGRTFDLLGDGSVRLAYTPGHSAGHMSVIVRLPRRDFVVAGDAVYDWRQFQGEAEPLMVADEHNWLRSLRELQAYRRAYPYALIVPGHDPEFWAKLDPRYEE